MLVTFHLLRDLVHLSGFLKPFVHKLVVSTGNILSNIRGQLFPAERLREKALKKRKGVEEIPPGIQTWEKRLGAERRPCELQLPTKNMLFGEV